MPDVSPPRAEPSSGCKYPDKAAAEGREGTTILRVQIDASGQPVNSVTTRSSGYDDLDLATLDCMKQRRFKPASRGREPVASVMLYKTDWKIAWGSGNRRTCSDIKQEITSHSAASSQMSSDHGPASANIVTVCVCFEESGRVQDPTLLQSSGSSRYDQGALLLAKSRSIRPQPPGFPGCFAFKTKFEPADEPSEPKQKMR